MSVVAGRRADRRRSRRTVIILIVTGLAGLSVVVTSPPAGAATPGPALTPRVALVPFPGDVYTLGTNGSLITVDPRVTQGSAPLFSLQGTRWA